MKERNSGNIVPYFCALLFLYIFLDSPRNVQSILEYTPLEAVVETQHEVLTEDNDDTALDLMSSSKKFRLLPITDGQMS